jgi:hypothetical protein
MKRQIIAGLLYALRVIARKNIYNGTGFGTYYYDVKQVDACGNDFALQNTGLVECSLLTALSLDQINSNYLVAINHSQLIGDMSTYCGKRVIVSVDGVQSSLPLFVGDGCQRCCSSSAFSNVWDPSSAPGLDFSYSVLSELSPNACDYGHISISWEIVDETLYDFGMSIPGAPEEAVAKSSGNSPTKTAITSTNSFTNPSALATVSSTSTDNRTLCVTGTWQCSTSANTIEQCLDDSWVPRATCAVGFACHGDNVPYCTP